MKLMKRITVSLAFGAILVISGTSRAAEHQKDIVETAAATGSFDTLVKAVQAAELFDALKADGPLTVFAPTDEAFSKVPAETLAALLKPENKDQLRAVLTYHVVAGKVMAADVISLDSVETLNGESVSIKVKNDTVTIDAARVVTADVAASNGVIHIIDTVLLPKGLSAVSD